MGCGAVPCLVEEPLKANLDHGQPSLLGVQADRLSALLHQVHLQVVLKVGAHPRQVVDRLNAHLSQLVSVTYA